MPIRPVLGQCENHLGYAERRACAVVGLDRSTYYDIKFRKPSDREIRRLLLGDAIADIHARSRGTYGILRVRAALEIEQGLLVNTSWSRGSCGHYRVRHDLVDKTGRVGMPASPSWPLCRHPARHSRAFGAPHGTPRAPSPPDRWIEA